MKPFFMFWDCKKPTINVFFSMSVYTKTHICAVAELVVNCITNPREMLIYLHHTSTEGDE